MRETASGRAGSWQLTIREEGNIRRRANPYRAGAVARAGLPPGRLRRVAASAAAVAETLAGHAVLLCTEPFARRHDLSWSPLADRTLHRGYEAGRRVGHRDARALDWLEPLLAEAIGAVRGSAASAPAGHRADPPDTRAWLAAYG